MVLIDDMDAAGLERLGWLETGRAMTEHRVGLDEASQLSFAMSAHLFRLSQIRRELDQLAALDAVRCVSAPTLGGNPCGLSTAQHAAQRTQALPVGVYAMGPS